MWVAGWASLSPKLSCCLSSCTGALSRHGECIAQLCRPPQAISGLRLHGKRANPDPDCHSLMPADLPLTGWSVFPLPLATLGALCLPTTNPASPAPAPAAAARTRPALTSSLQARCAPADPAPGAASPLVCERVPRPGRFDPATDGPVLYRWVIGPSGSVHRNLVLDPRVCLALVQQELVASHRRQETEICMAARISTLLKYCMIAKGRLTVYASCSSY